MIDESSESIQLTPDFAHMFAMFAREARSNADTILADLPEQFYREDCIKQAQAETLRAFHGLLVPLNICAGSMHNAEAVNLFRELIANVTLTINRKANEIEAALAPEGSN